MKKLFLFSIPVFFLCSCSRETTHSFLVYDENETLNSTAALVIKKKKSGLMAWNIVENGGRMLLLSEFAINKDSIHVQFPSEISSAALTRDSLKLMNFTIKKDSSLYHFAERIREEK